MTKKDFDIAVARITAHRLEIGRERVILKKSKRTINDASPIDAIPRSHQMNDEGGLHPTASQAAPTKPGKQEA